MNTVPVRVGVFAPPDLLAKGPEATAAFLAEVERAGLDHVCCGDHVSFAGAGFDGLLQATALSMLHPSLPVHIGVYLLPLRHPTVVARQLADLAHIAPGRLVFGVGVGGEDRREVANCGTDPSTRGRRMDECMTVLRALLTGEPLTHRGRFVDVEQAVIRPAPSAPIPIVVGGRSDAAIRRAGRLGDGWLGIWVSPRRFAAGVGASGSAATSAGRSDTPRRHALQVWCGFADSMTAARAGLASAMEEFYRLPFDGFERYCPYGTAADVARYLAGYVAAGCTEFNLIATSPDPGRAVADAATVRTLLTAMQPTGAG